MFRTLLTCISKEVIIVRRGKRSKGYGFAGYDTQEEADKAVKELTKKELDGREIKVQISNPQAAKKKPRKNRPASKRTGRKNVSGCDRLCIVVTLLFRLKLLNLVRRRNRLLQLKPKKLPLLIPPRSKMTRTRRKHMRRKLGLIHLSLLPTFPSEWVFLNFMPYSRSTRLPLL